jgi:hypothetical protein
MESRYLVKVHAGVGTGFNGVAGAGKDTSIDLDRVGVAVA